MFKNHRREVGLVPKFLIFHVESVFNVNFAAPFIYVYASMIHLPHLCEFLKCGIKILKIKSVPIIFEEYENRKTIE